MRLHELALLEAFNAPYPLTWEKSDYGDMDALAKLPDGTYLSIMFNNDGDEWQVEFHRNNSQEITGEGDAQRIFATVLNSIHEFIEKEDPERIRFSASKEDESGQITNKIGRAPRLNSSHMSESRMPSSA